MHPSTVGNQVIVNNVFWLEPYSIYTWILITFLILYNFFIDFSHRSKSIKLINGLTVGLVSMYYASVLRAELLQRSALRLPFATALQSAEAVSAGKIRIIVREHQVHFAKFLQQQENFALATALAKNPIEERNIPTAACADAWRNPDLVFVESESYFIDSCALVKEAVNNLLEFCIDDVQLFVAFAFPKSARKYRERSSRATEFLLGVQLRQLREFTFQREIVKQTWQTGLQNQNQKQPLNMLAMKWLFVTFYLIPYMLSFALLLFEIKQISQ